MATYREVQESGVARCTRDDGGFRNGLWLGIPEVQRDRRRERWLRRDGYKPQLDLTYSEYLLKAASFDSPWPSSRALLPSSAIDSRHALFSPPRPFLVISALSPPPQLLLVHSATPPGCRSTSHIY
jgi:hypothetical protein